MIYDTYIREKVFSKLNDIVNDGDVNGLYFEDKFIPVFDEYVNPNITIPVVRGASTYIILQDQSEQFSSIQNVCNVVFDLSLTIRIVTKFGTVGGKKLSEDIGREVINRIMTKRGDSKIEGIKRVELINSTSYSEQSKTNLAFSKILILNFIKNG